MGRLSSCRLLPSRPHPRATPPLGSGLRRQVLVPFALGTVLLVGLVSAITTLATMSGAASEQQRHAAAVRQTIVDTLGRRQERLEADARRVAEQDAVGRALERGERPGLGPGVVASGLGKELDHLAVHDARGRLLLADGQTGWEHLPVTRGSVRGARLGLRERGVGVGPDGRPILIAAVPVRAGRGIVGVVVAGRVVDTRALAELGRPLAAELAIAARVRTDREVRAVVGRMPAGRRYVFPLQLSLASRGRAQLVVGLSAEPLDRRRRSALLLGVGSGLLLAVALVGLAGALLNRAVLAPLAGLRGAIARVRRQDYDIALEPRGARELRELADGFNRMVGIVGEQHARLESLAATDPLTGLANHRHFHDRLAEELERARRGRYPLSVVVVDLDHFKRVNDRHGHPVGDELLRAVGTILLAAGREADLVARLGGEEFGIVLPNCDQAGAHAVADRLRAAVARVPGPSRGVTCSAGVASFPSDARDAVGLVELADGALYWAKRSGRDQVRCYDPAHVSTRSAGEQRAQVADLLARPDGLRAVFQPIVALRGGEVVGHEALARFADGAPADVWFARSRRAGLAPQLEAAAIRAALAAGGPPLGRAHLSLNLSPNVLSSAEVAAALPDDLTGVVVEITEHELVGDDQRLAHDLAALRRRGARIAVDDAGAGYAGLKQLMRVQPDVIKLDRALVEHIDRDFAKAALVESFVSFGRRTGAVLCAEGVERPEELRALADAGVDYAQGYFLARPGAPWPAVSAEALELCRSLEAAPVQGRGLSGAPAR
jgi:diguanylate cyclase (GGDEF)-like protein